MGELALRRKGGKNNSFYQMTKTNISMTRYNSIYYDYKNAVKIGSLSPSVKSGRFVVEDYNAASHDVGGGSTTKSDTHYSDAVALFSIGGYNSGSNSIDAGDYTGKQARSCIPYTAGALVGIDSICTLKAPVVFWFTDGGRMESEDEVYAEGDMTFEVSFSTNTSGAKVLVFDWFFDGTVKEHMYNRSGSEVSVSNLAFLVSVDIIEGE